MKPLFCINRKRRRVKHIKHWMMCDYEQIKYRRRPEYNLTLWWERHDIRCCFRKWVGMYAPGNNIFESGIDLCTSFVRDNGSSFSLPNVDYKILCYPEEFEDRIDYFD